MHVPTLIPSSNRYRCGQRRNPVAAREPAAPDAIHGHVEFPRDSRRDAQDEPPGRLGAVEPAEQKPYRTEAAPAAEPYGSPEAGCQLPPGWVAVWISADAVDTPIPVEMATAEKPRGLTERITEGWKGGFGTAASRSIQNSLQKIRRGCHFNRSRQELMPSFVHSRLDRS